MPAQTWNIKKVAQPVLSEYSARDSINYFVTTLIGALTRVAPLNLLDAEEKIPTIHARSMSIGYETTAATVITLRKYHLAGLAFVDEVFAVGIGTGVVASTTLLECAEIYATNGAANGQIRVTAIARA
jgi:hypothetical protein